MTNDELFVKWFLFLFLLYGFPLLVLILTNVASSSNSGGGGHSEPIAKTPKSVGDYWPE
jgi:hypothetical protein